MPHDARAAAGLAQGTCLGSESTCQDTLQGGLCFVLQRSPGQASAWVGLEEPEQVPGCEWPPGGTGVGGVCVCTRCSVLWSLLI